MLGAITLVAAESGRRFGEDDLRIAEELARRAASRDRERAASTGEAEARAQAARVLETIGDGVVLVDRDGRVRLWNTRGRGDHRPRRRPRSLGRPAVEALPGWATIAPRIPIAQPGGRPRRDACRSRSTAASSGSRSRRVGFEDGTVYAFRDLTEERALEQMRADFVATVSHELRTPLAAIYGAALTLRRDDVELDERAARAAARGDRARSPTGSREIVNDILLASQLDSGKLQRARSSACDPRAARASVDRRSADAPARERRARARRADEAAAGRGRPRQLRQVLVNLSTTRSSTRPTAAGRASRLARDDRHVRFAVTDDGLGIPPSEQRRIFEKFYRLDPNMTRGIGGTGLGLYICRELVRRIDGRIWVESDGRTGSTFLVEIPQEAAPASRGRRPPPDRGRVGAA